MRNSALMKRHRVAEGYTNLNNIYVSYKRLTSDVKTHRLKVRRQKAVFPTNANKKKSTNTYARQNEM